MADGMNWLTWQFRRAALPVRRAVLIPLLKRKAKVRAFSRGYAVLYAVECSTEEERETAEITDAELVVLRRGMEHYCGSSRKLKRIHVLCIGRGARVEGFPASIRQAVHDPFGWGEWDCELDVGLALFQDELPMRRIVLHELCHALLHRLSQGFRYPSAIDEGFARRAEFFVPSAAGGTAWRTSIDAVYEARYYLEPLHGSMSIRELLSFNARDHWRKDVYQFARMTGWSFWFNMYLGTLGNVLETLLPELRRRNIRSADGVLKWLNEATGLDESALEKRFAEYCTDRRNEPLWRYARATDSLL